MVKFLKIDLFFFSLQCLVIAAIEASAVDWNLHQKLKTIENSLIQNENLSKFIKTRHRDNDFLQNDATKAKRTYNNTQCITDLQWIQNSFDDGANKWAFESIVIRLLLYDRFSEIFNLYNVQIQCSTVGVSCRLVILRSILETLISVEISRE